MLLSFVIENFRSFQDEATLDMQQRSFRTNIPKDNDWNAATHRVAGIFGANASGKSNLLLAFATVAEAVSWSVPDPRASINLWQPHAAAKGPGSVCAFQTEYVAENTRYRYLIEFGSKGIEFESLEANLTGHWRQVFQRTGLDLKFGSKSGIGRAAQDNLKDLLHAGSLTLSAMKLSRSSGEHSRAARWWSDAVLLLSPMALHHQEVVELVHSSPAWLKVAREVIRSADLGITDMHVREDEVPQNIRELARKMNRILHEETEGNFTEIPVDDLKEVFQYLEFRHSSDKGDFTVVDAQESLGTRSWLDTAVLAIRAIVLGRVFVVDEVDTSLHPVLVRILVKLFSDSTINQRGAQLVFTSHDITILGKHPCPAVTPDEAWLVRKENGSSELINLAEFDDTRSQHNIEQRYLRGLYGGVPYVDWAELKEVVLALESDRGE